MSGAAWGAPSDVGVGGSSRKAVFANPLAVALDTDDLDQATRLAEDLSHRVGLLKVGLELFAAHGPEAVEAVGRHGPVFLDLKLHDIPTTVGRAVHQAARLGAAMLTVHASGGEAMVAAAVEAAGSAERRPLVVAVTVLTSLGDADLAAMNLGDRERQVSDLAGLARAAGADGVVCAPADARRLREQLGAGSVLVTPGVRPQGGGRDDHAATLSPEDAVAAGADVIVVGRPITAAADPVAAAEQILRDIGAGGR